MGYQNLKLRYFPRCNFRVAETGQADGVRWGCTLWVAMIKLGRPSYGNGPGDPQVHKRAKVEWQLLLLHCNGALG